MATKKANKAKPKAKPKAPPNVKAAVKQAEVEAASLAAKTDPVQAELDPNYIDGIRIYALSYMRVQVLQSAITALGIDEDNEQGEQDAATLSVFVLVNNRATIKVLGRNPKKLLDRAEEWADGIHAVTFLKLGERAGAELSRLGAANDIDVPGPDDNGEPEKNAAMPIGSPTDSAKD